MDVVIGRRLLQNFRPDLSDAPFDLVIEQAWFRGSCDNFVNLHKMSPDALQSYPCYKSALCKLGVPPTFNGCSSEMPLRKISCETRIHGPKSADVTGCFSSNAAEFTDGGVRNETDLNSLEG